MGLLSSRTLSFGHDPAAAAEDAPPSTMSAARASGNAQAHAPRRTSATPVARHTAIALPIICVKLSRFSPLPATTARSTSIDDSKLHVIRAAGAAQGRTEHTRTLSSGHSSQRGGISLRSPETILWSRSKLRATRKPRSYRASSRLSGINTAKGPRTVSVAPSDLLGSQACGP